MNSQIVSCSINGKTQSFDADPSKPLAELLRERGYLSVKEGRRVDECVACNVLVNGIAVKPCLCLKVRAKIKDYRDILYFCNAAR